MEEQLIDYISELLSMDTLEINEDTDLLDICIFDYVEFFDIIYNIEEHFNISIMDDDTDDIEHIRTVGKLSELIKEKIGVN